MCSDNVYHNQFHIFSTYISQQLSPNTALNSITIPKYSSVSDHSVSHHFVIDYHSHCEGTYQHQNKNEDE